jgi:TrmH family RNA methyltransferase
VTTRGSADPWSPKALRASAGSGLRVPILRGMAIPVLLAQLRVAGVKIVAASSHSAASGAGGDDAAADLRGGVAIFIGNEGGGLPREIENVADARLSIPMSAGVESLNAAVAASVVLYEAARQRKSFTPEEH